MNPIDIEDTDLYEFWESWKKANSLYAKMCPGNHMMFPEPLFKVFVERIFPSLKRNRDKSYSYDFKGNIEVKSSTTKSGVTHFNKTSQNNCSRILFFRIINNQIELYDINDSTVLSKINQAISESKNGNITLMNYIDGIEPKEIHLKKPTIKR